MPHVVHPAAGTRSFLGRQPLLYAALAFAAGTLASGRLPLGPASWIVIAVALAAGALVLHARRHLAAGIALLALLGVGAAASQLSRAAPPRAPGLERFLERKDITVVAHVTDDPTSRPALFGGTREVVDVETEEVAEGDFRVPLRAGLRLSIYARENGEDGPPALAYGQRLRFAGKLRPPRNFNNPGAFDYRGYLRRNGIDALASTSAETLEGLPGFDGTRWEHGAADCALRRWRASTSCGARTTPRWWRPCCWARSPPSRAARRSISSAAGPTTSWSSPA